MEMFALRFFVACLHVISGNTLRVAQVVLNLHFPFACICLLSVVQFAFHFREIRFFDFIDARGGFCFMVGFELIFRRRANQSIDIAKEEIQQIPHSDKNQKANHRGL